MNTPSEAAAPVGLWFRRHFHLEPLESELLRRVQDHLLADLRAVRPTRTTPPGRPPLEPIRTQRTRI